MSNGIIESLGGGKYGFRVKRIILRDSDTMPRGNDLIPRDRIIEKIIITKRP